MKETQTAPTRVVGRYNARRRPDQAPDANPATSATRQHSSANQKRKKKPVLVLVPLAAILLKVALEYRP